MVIRWEESPFIRSGKVIGVYLLWFLKDLTDVVIAVLISAWVIIIRVPEVRYPSRAV
jgi:hypothetical protein